MFLNETNVLETLETLDRIRYKNSIKRIKSLMDLDLHIRNVVKTISVVKVLPIVINDDFEKLFISSNINISIYKWYRDCVTIVKANHHKHCLNGIDFNLGCDIEKLSNKEAFEYICDKLDGIVEKYTSKYSSMVSCGISETFNEQFCVKLTNYLTSNYKVGFEDNISDYIDIYHFCRKIVIKYRLGANMRSSMYLRLRYNPISEIISKEEGIRLNSPSMYKFIMDFGVYNPVEISESKLKSFVHELLNSNLKSQHYKLESSSAALIREKVKEYKKSLI